MLEREVLLVRLVTIYRLNSKLVCKWNHFLKRDKRDGHIWTDNRVMESWYVLGQTIGCSLASTCQCSSIRIIRRKIRHNHHLFTLYLSNLTFDSNILKDDSNEILVSLDSELCLNEEGKIVGTQTPTEHTLLLNARIELSSTGHSLSLTKSFTPKFIKTNKIFGLNF